MKRSVVLAHIGLVIAAIMISPLSLAGNNWYPGKDCLSKEGQEYVHRLLADCKENFGGTHNGDCPPEMIAEIVEEALNNPKFRKIKGAMQCAKKATRAARKAKRFLGPLGVVVGVFFFAEDARAEGLCMATCRATPGVDVVVEGWEEIDKTAEEINDWAQEQANQPVAWAHVLAGQMFETLLGPLGDLSDKDGEAVASCLSAFYDSLHSQFMLQLAAQPTPILGSYDYSFLNDPNFMGPMVAELHNNLNECLDNATLPPVVCPFPPPPPECCCVSCEQLNCPNCDY